MLPRRTPCRIIAIDRVAPDVKVVKLRMPLNENIRYLPGQHLAFELGDGVKREYSIANVCRPEGMTEFELHIRHLPGGLFTERLFNELAVRALMRLEVPLGTFFLRTDSDRAVILMATGTGFAPIKAMIEHAMLTGEIERRDFRLYWGGRGEADLYMADLARQWAEAHGRFSFVPVLSRPAEGWAGRTGYVQDRVMEDNPDLSSFDVYACGSPAMIEDAAARFGALDTRAPIHFYADEFLTEAERAARLHAIEEEKTP
jgi:CDP-4-dehydro-6-deoxyglucose reductase